MACPREMCCGFRRAAPEPFLKSSFTDASPTFSPDGRWLAYHSNESGKNEIYVCAFPLWSHSSHELVYQSGDQIMSVAYTGTGNTFMAEKARVWMAKLGK